MNRHLLDPRVFAPVLCGLAVVAPRALPEPAPASPGRVRARELPQLPLQKRDTKARALQLDAEGSSVRFLVDDGRSRLVAACQTMTGSMRRDGDTGELELRIDLASATSLASNAGLDVHRVLGVRHTDEIVYRAKLVAAATSDLPGVERLLFVGQLTIGDRVIQHPMQLWSCALPGRPLRLQGHGFVPTDDWRRPERHWPVVTHARRQMLLGLDLEWRRDAR